jgi:hypothetical protein
VAGSQHRGDQGLLVSMDFGTASRSVNRSSGCTPTAPPSPTLSTARAGSATRPETLGSRALKAIIGRPADMNYDLTARCCGSATASPALSNPRCTGMRSVAGTCSNRGSTTARPSPGADAPARPGPRHPHRVGPRLDHRNDRPSQRPSRVVEMEPGSRISWPRSGQHRPRPLTHSRQREASAGVRKDSRSTVKRSLVVRTAATQRDLSGLRIGHSAGSLQVRRVPPAGFEPAPPL